MADNLTGTDVMDHDPSSGVARVGAGLREVRERLGWKLPDVAEALRIRLEYLTAIEQGDLSPLPGPAYRTGFVRAYAQILGLDGEEILRRFREAGELSDTQNVSLKVLAPVPDRGVPRGALALVGVVAVLAGYGLWYHFTADNRHLASNVPPVPAELAPLALPPVVKSTVADATAPTAKPDGQAAPQAAVAPAAKPQTPVQAPAPATQTAAPATPAAPPGAGMVITATQDAWIQVQDSTGNILFSKVLHAGDTWPVPQEAGLTMTTGNAGGTEIVTDGTAGAPLGAVGVVMHNYALTPAAAPASPAPAAPGTTK
jgi:cytoskeleton protein RodZ